MRNILEAVVTAILLVALVLAAAGLTALGIAFIGLLLHRWFDLTQWQGTLIALAASASFALLLHRALRGPVPTSVYTPEWEEEETEEEEAAEPEPPIVPWRRSRPTPAEPSSARPEKGQGAPGRSSKTRR